VKNLLCHGTLILVQNIFGLAFKEMGFEIKNILFICLPIENSKTTRLIFFAG